MERIGVRSTPQVLQADRQGQVAACGTQPILEADQHDDQRAGKLDMNKVITINLNGNAYQLEERGYELLCGYLDAAAAQLKDNPDRAEIISDLEQAIADKCRNFLGPQKTIVTGAEIEQIIQAMGPVDSEDGAGAAGASQSGSSQSDRQTDTGNGSKSGPYTPKRLYRIREGKQIEGVCTGLAAYFGMDVTIVRLIFVAVA